MKEFSKGKFIKWDMLRNLLINKQKKLFLFFGFLNFLITNAALQIFLLFIPILFSTILSQIINFFIGYYLYGKKVFKLNKLTNLVFRKYFVLAFILWALNFCIIRTFFYFGVNKNITALLVIPLLVVISYFFQKRFVFKWLVIFSFKKFSLKRFFYNLWFNPLRIILINITKDILWKN